MSEAAETVQQATKVLSLRAILLAGAALLVPLFVHVNHLFYWPSLFVLLLLRWRLSAQTAPNAPPRFRPATEGASKTFSTRTPVWWLVGDRLDLNLVYPQLGAEAILALSTNFYTRVYSDKEEQEYKWFADMFSNRVSRRDSIIRQANFFFQMWGGPKAYTAANVSRCPLSTKKVGKMAGFPFFLKHDKLRKHDLMTEHAAIRWRFHMDNALDEEVPKWRQKLGGEAKMVEKTIRWFFDHGSEALVWGGPTESPYTKRRIIFSTLKWINKHFVDIRYPGDDAGAGAIDKNKAD